MRFMIIRKGDAETEASVMPTAEMAQDMVDYHEEMGRALKILGGDGLQPTSKGARVKFRRGKPFVTDGPFAEVKEVIAGYTLVEADSLAQVLAWVRKWPQSDGHGEVEIEVRQLYELEDLGDAFADDALKVQAARVLNKG